VSSEDWQVVEAMSVYGGNFVRCLAAAFKAADPTNFKKLKDAFAVVWQEYTELVQAVHQCRPLLHFSEPP